MRGATAPGASPTRMRSRRRSRGRASRWKASGASPPRELARSARAPLRDDVGRRGDRPRRGGARPRGRRARRAAATRWRRSGCPRRPRPGLQPHLARLAQPREPGRGLARHRRRGRRPRGFARRALPRRFSRDGGPGDVHLPPGPQWRGRRPGALRGCRSRSRGCGRPQAEAPTGEPSRARGVAGNGHHARGAAAPAPRFDARQGCCHASVIVALHNPRIRRPRLPCTARPS